MPSRLRAFAMLAAGALFGLAALGVLSVTVWMILARG